jgi:hypothetical protein
MAKRCAEVHFVGVVESVKGNRAKIMVFPKFCDGLNA